MGTSAFWATQATPSPPTFIDCGLVDQRMIDAVGRLQNEMRDTVGSLQSEMRDAVGRLQQEMRGTVESLQNDMRNTMERPNSDSTENAVVAVLTDIAEVLKNSQTRDEVDALKEKVENVEARVEGLQSELRETRVADIILLNGEEHEGPSECPRVCSGTTGRGVTQWVEDSTQFHVDVDISDCGFTTVPIVTTAIEGEGYHSVALGTSSVYSTTNKTFRMYIHPNKHDGDVNIGNINTSRFKWNVEWIAIGQSC